MSSELGPRPPAIAVDGLGKRYELVARGGNRPGHGSLREAMAGYLRSPRRRGVPKQDQSFWALRDVSFDIAAGERVAIIGRNGAGKSTLLKILCRITPPTEGSARVRGNVGSLLEVGTGFHAELSGRDNIYLSGAILGMHRADINERLDEIVEFAGVAKFLDTPVKRYSSGMYLRLAFSVAAHLEAEILLVDEVLAVGDAEFQKKCLGRMAELGRSDRTVVFVSHSMPAVLRLCERAIFLDGGRVVADGPAPAVVAGYIDAGLGSTAERHWVSPEHGPGDDVARLKSVRVLSDTGSPADELEVRHPVNVEVEYWFLGGEADLRPTVSLHFNNQEGICLFVSNDFNNRSWWQSAREPGVVRASCRVPGNFLAEGRISVLAAVCSYHPPTVHALEHDAISFNMVDRSTGDGARGEYLGDWPGVVRPMLEWSVDVVGRLEAHRHAGRDDEH